LPAVEPCPQTWGSVEDIAAMAPAPLRTAQRWVARWARERVGIVREARGRGGRGGVRYEVNLTAARWLLGITT
jgi:hypothetical protein